MNEEIDLTDEALIRAIRKRLLEEISSPKEVDRIINNVYGAGPSAGQPTSGVMGQLGNTGDVPEGEDPFDYFVDIAKRNVSEDEIDPETGEVIGQKPIGWDKNVHRYRKKKT